MSISERVRAATGSTSPLTSKTSAPLTSPVPVLARGGKSLTYPASTGGIGNHRGGNRGGSHGAAKRGAGNLGEGRGRHQQLVRHSVQFLCRGHGPCRVRLAR